MSRLTGDSVSLGQKRGRAYDLAEDETFDGRS